MRFLLSIFMFLFFVGCAGFKVLPESKYEVNNGIYLMESKKDSSKVGIALAQDDTRDQVLALYVTIESNNKEIFNIDSINAKFQESKSNKAETIKIYTYNELRRKDIDFIDILQDFRIPTPTPNVNYTQTRTFSAVPFFYSTGFVGFMPFMGPTMVDDSNEIAYRTERRSAQKVFLLHYLRESNMGKTPIGGFIALKKIKKQGTLKVAVKIQNDEHIFYINIK